MRSEAGRSRPVTNLDKLTASLKDTDGVQRINDFLYYLTLATNGYDSVGHYLRAGLVASDLLQLLARRRRQHRPAGASSTTPRRSSTASRRRLPRGAQRRPRKLASGGIVPRRNSLLQKLIGTPGTEAQAQQRQQSLERLRERSKSPSPALQERRAGARLPAGGEQ